MQSLGSWSKVKREREREWGFRMPRSMVSHRFLFLGVEAAADGGRERVAPTLVYF